MPLGCLAGNKVTGVHKEVHPGVGGEQQGGFRVYKQLIHLGYYWFTMEVDATSFVRRCQACQLKVTESTSIVELHNLSTPWPFYCYIEVNLDLSCNRMLY